MNTSFPCLIEPEDIGNVDTPVLIIDLCSDAQYHQGHVPGAVHVSPRQLVDGRSPAPGKLPEKSRLDDLFSQLGLTADMTAVLYDDEGGGWAGRMAWTLDVIGHERWCYLNGGLAAWAREGHPLETITNEVRPRPVSVNINPAPIANAEDIMANLDNGDFRIWDARSRDEYLGVRQTAARNGHIPGAVHCEWTSLMDLSRNHRIRSDAREYLASLGLTPDHHIATHCQSHHRSGFTYMVARILGYPAIRGYHGSWSEWGNRTDTPVATGGAQQ